MAEIEVGKSRSGVWWRAFSALAIIVASTFGVWWNVSVPTVGKGGLLLGFGAVLMPLFWEKAGVIGKMFWIFVLFLLLVVEYRAIDKEHRESNKAQREALEASSSGFAQIIKDERSNFADLLQKNQDQFKQTVEQSQRQFGATMGQITGGNTYAVVIPVTAGANLKERFALKMQVGKNCDKNSLSDARVYLFPGAFPEKLNKWTTLTVKEQKYLIFDGPLDPAYPKLLEKGIEDLGTYTIIVLARNHTTREMLEIRTNPKTSTQEYSYKVTRVGKTVEVTEGWQPITLRQYMDK